MIAIVNFIIMDEHTITISVGSKNPVKFKSALDGSIEALGLSSHNVIAEGFNVSSLVSDQPFGDEETKLGSSNRARHAYQEYLKSHGIPPSYSIGLEGGCLLNANKELECFAWITVFNGKKMGYSRTASFTLPSCIRDLVINEHLELGDADDRVFGTVNSKQSSGTVGHLTKGVIDRCLYYVHAVVLAFIPFNWPSLYDDV